MGIPQSLLTLLIVLTSIFMAVAPMVVALMFIWWLDRYDREPLGLLFVLFAWGAVGGTLIGGFLTLELHRFAVLAVGPKAAYVLTLVALAPILEEVAKGIGLFGVALHSKFDNMTDGIVYGAGVGLGFAMTENLLYFFRGYLTGGLLGWGVMVLLRTFFSAWVHMAASACWGAGLGAAKYAKGRRIVWWPLVGMGGAVLVHAVWNACTVMTIETGSQVPILSGFVLLPLVVLLLLVIFQVSLSRERLFITAELTEEAALRIVPAEHVGILSSYARRMRGRWGPADPRVRSVYVRLTTELAFRKRQARRARPRQIPKLLEQVQLLREKIRGLKVEES